ncbi:YdcF family protein [Bacillus sp. J37]|uniref:YdcF family protein n=1 Tax=Bacillus sp. J37 TaxID=935837 RepID=UPI0004B3A90F|nr:YdcF family protein [Bacillus sp. J37]
MELDYNEISTPRLKKYKVNRKKKRNRIVVLIFFPIMLLSLLLYAANFLVVNEDPKKSDVIIVLSGYEGRLEKGIDLFNRGFGEYLILTNSDYFNEEKLLKSGIPMDKIIYEQDADSTYTNATLTKNIMLDHKFDSAIIVTSEFHTSRSKYIFNKVYKDLETDLTYVASKNDFFNSRYWWDNEKSRYVVWSEYTKWLGYLLLY